MDLTTMSPREIDTILADLYSQYNQASRKAEAVTEHAMHVAGARRQYGRGRAHWNLSTDEAWDKVETLAKTDETYVGRDAQKALDRRASAVAERDAVHVQMSAIGAEFNRRGGWTRAFLVTDGHVHSSRQCSTCNNGQYATKFHWLTEFSGGTEAEVVAAAADRACTVCYPTAPVETAGPSALMTPDERTRAQQREDAEKARADRLAKRIEKGLTADGSEFVVSYRWLDRDRRESFKTEQAATSWLVQYTLWDHGRTDEKAEAFAAIREAIAVKHGWTAEEVNEHLAAKMVAKVKRDEGISKADAEAKVARIMAVAR